MRFIKQLFNLKEIQRPLGRWGLHNKDYLKTDYANIDNCGDLLCQNPASPLLQRQIHSAVAYDPQFYCRETGMLINGMSNSDR